MFSTTATHGTCSLLNIRTPFSTSMNASFCGVDDITGEQAVELQDRNMVLHGNPVTEITWAYQNQLTKIPAWLRTLEKVTYADLGYCDVKEMKGGAFPASLEELNIQNQVAGLRLHPDSFEGLSKLRRLEINTNKLTEDDMHPGLFGDTRLEWLTIMGNPDMLNFDAAALFPGSSGQQLEFLKLVQCGLTGIGGESGTNFHGLLALEQLHLDNNNFGDGIAEDAFAGECRSSGRVGSRFQLDLLQSSKTSSISTCMTTMTSPRCHKASSQSCAR